MADVVREKQSPAACTMGDAAGEAALGKRLLALEHSVRADLKGQGFKASNISIEFYLHLRVRGCFVCSLVRCVL
jgi:hypothetical protein